MAFEKLEKVEREYQEAVSALEMQKADAKRWLQRQQVRLIVQSAEVAKEKAIVASIMENDVMDLNSLQKQLGVNPSTHF
jgi:hypothetical protein